MIEAKIDELLAKGIRPTDIAKIYDLKKSDVVSYVKKKKNAEKALKLRGERIAGIMKIAKIDEATAENVYSYCFGKAGERLK